LIYFNLTSFGANQTIVLSKLRLNVHNQDQALFFVGIGVLITLAQMYGLFFIFGDNYIQSRAVINSMTIAAPLLCFGFDVTAPQITKQEKTSGFVWNFLILQLLLMVCFLLMALNIDDPNTSNIFLGMSLGAVFASKLFIVEYERSLGKVKQYFFDLHIRDRFYRTAAILLVALAIKSITTWAIILLLFSVIYLGIMAFKYRKTIRFDRKKLTHHLLMSVPYLLTSLATVMIYRLAFYISYYHDGSTYTSKVDFWSLLALFVLLPYVNASKFSETFAKDQVSHYITLVQKSWIKVSQQQVGIVVIIAGIVTLACFMGKANQQDIIEIILPLILATTIASLSPSFCYLALLSGRIKLSFITSILFVILSLSCYTPKFFDPQIPVSYLMLMNSIIYVAISTWASNYYLGINPKSILRIRQGAGVILIVSVLFVCIYYLALV